METPKPGQGFNLPHRLLVEMSLENHLLVLTGAIPGSWGRSQEMWTQVKAPPVSWICAPEAPRTSAAPHQSLTARGNQERWIFLGTSPRTAGLGQDREVCRYLL